MHFTFTYYCLLYFVFVISIIIPHPITAQHLTESPIVTHYQNQSLQKANISFSSLPYDGVARSFLIQELPNSAISNYSQAGVPSGLVNALHGHLSLKTMSADIRAKVPIALNLRTSHQGEYVATLNTRIKPQYNTLKISTLADGYWYNGELDENNDGFRDLPHRKRIFINQKGSAKFGMDKTVSLYWRANYINAERYGGELFFDNRPRASNPKYGYGADSEYGNALINFSVPIGVLKRSSIDFYADGSFYDAFQSYGTKFMGANEQVMNIKLNYFNWNALGDWDVGVWMRAHNLVNELNFQPFREWKLRRYSAYGSYSTFINNRMKLEGVVRADWERHKLELFPRAQLDVHLKFDDYSSEWGTVSAFVAREKQLNLPLWDNLNILNSSRIFVLPNSNSIYNRGWVGGITYTLPSVSFEIPGFYDWWNVRMDAPRALLRTTRLDGHSEMSIVDRNDAPDIVEFFRVDAPSWRHWLELSGGFKLEQLAFKATYRRNAFSENAATDNWMLPKHSWMLLSVYDFDFGLKTSLAYFSNNDRILYDGTQSGSVRRWDWYNSMDLSAIWTNWFTKRNLITFKVLNIFDDVQPNPVVGSGDPFGASFDAAQVWGNTVGRRWVIGLRFK